MTALAGVELESLVSEPDALTTRPPPCKLICYKFTNTDTYVQANKKKRDESKLLVLLLFLHQHDTLNMHYEKLT